MNRLKLSLPPLALVPLLFMLAGCGGKQGSIASAGWSFGTDSGPVAWDSAGSAGVTEERYRDSGVEHQALLVEGGSGAKLSLAGPALAVEPGRPWSFRFDLRSLEATGLVLEARLELLDQAGAVTADSLLYRVGAAEDTIGRGLTGDWISYTRALRIPAGAAAARVRVTSAPAGGQVWLGRCEFRSGEGWLAHAASFSTHLARVPEDKYVFTAARYLEPDSTPAPSAPEQAAGFIFFERPGLYRALPQANPRQGERVAELRVRVPRGTVAPFAFGVKALEDLGGVSVELARPPLGARGAELAGRPALRQGRYAATRLEGSWSKVFYVRTRMLEPPAPKPLPRGENQFFWLDLPVPENAAPGEYRGQLRLTAAGHQPLELPLVVEVVPVTLPAQPGDYAIGMYWYPAGEDWPALDRELKDMAAHGINGISLSGSFVMRTETGQVRLDQPRVQRLAGLMSLMKRNGFCRPTSLYISDIFERLELPERAGDWTEEHRALFTRAIRLMHDTAVAWQMCPIRFFAVDEPANDPEQLELARLTHELLRAIPGVKTISDLNTPASVEQFAPYLDAVVIQISSVNPHTLELTKGQGLATYWYQPCLGSSDVGHDAAWHRAMPGWFLPRIGADGVYYFAYQLVEGDPYDELDGANRDWCATYPGQQPGESWPSPEYLGIRRGVEDLRLVVLARALIERSGRATDQAGRERGEAAGRKLEELLSRIADSGPAVIYQLHHELEPDVAEKWRQELLEEVLELQRALGIG